MWCVQYTSSPYIWTSHQNLIYQSPSSVLSPFLPLNVCLFRPYTRSFSPSYDKICKSFFSMIEIHQSLLKIAIYVPMIYIAPCIMFWMRVYPLRGYLGWGWALEFESFLGPVKWHRTDRRVPFVAQKTQDFQSPTPSHLLS